MSAESGPGTVIAAKYSLLHKIGEGGMGSVWKAQHLALNAPVAVKLIDPAIAQDKEALGRFLREAQAAAALQSSHVVQTFDYGVHDGVPYIVMEMLQGESLADWLAREQTLSPEATGTILNHVARAMSRAHELGIVHRDLKPDNVFVARNEDGEVHAKVLDFGVAKATGSAAMALTGGATTQAGAVMGTPFYMSPEQAQGIADLDYRTDLWAMGVIAYECLTGQLPFESAALGDLMLKLCVAPIPVPSLQASVPAGFDAWFARACQRKPEERFASARDLARSFREDVLGADDESLVSRPVATKTYRLTLEDDASRKARPLALTTGGNGSMALGAGKGGAVRRWLYAGAAVAALALLGAGVAFTRGRAASGSAESHSEPARGVAPAPPAAPGQGPAAAPSLAPSEPVVARAAGEQAAGEAAALGSVGTTDAAVAEPAAGPTTTPTKKASAPRARRAPAASATKSQTSTQSFDPLRMRR